MARIFHPTGSPVARERCDDIVRRWLTPCGKDSCFYMFETLNDITDEQLADRCICGWGLDQSGGDDNDLIWFEVHDANRTMLIEAFAKLRADFTKNV